MEGFARSCPVVGCDFVTSNWETKRLATLRINEHVKEHETGQPMRELIEFETEHELRRSR